jgi:hypothetical protein
MVKAAKTALLRGPADKPGELRKAAKPDILSAHPA